MEFDPCLTIIVAENGTRKSTVMEAVVLHEDYIWAVPSRAGLLANIKLEMHYLDPSGFPLTQKLEALKAQGTILANGIELSSTVFSNDTL